MSTQNKSTIEVLLIEDLEEDAKLAIRALKKYHVAVDVKWVDDGEAALHYIFGENGELSLEIKPRIILLDLKLPKVNGLQILQTLKTDDRTKDIPVVVMTSSKEKKDIEEAYQNGANSYIVKPVDFKKYSEVIDKIGMYWLSTNERPS